MRHFLLTFVLALTSLGVRALPYDVAREQALFLSDKMAYELNLTPSQYDYVYEINLDYFLNVQRYTDCYGNPWAYRNADLRCVLYDWQWRVFEGVEYFLRPLRWLGSAWYYPVYEHYRTGYFFFRRPAIYISFRGTPGWAKRGHGGPSPYANRRPAPAPPHAGPGGMRDQYHKQFGGHPDNRSHNQGKPNTGRGNQPNVQPGNQGGRGGQPNVQPGNQGGRGNQPNVQPGNQGGRGNQPNVQPGNQGGRGGQPNVKPGNQGGRGNQPSRTTSPVRNSQRTSATPSNSRRTPSATSGRSGVTRGTSSSRGVRSR